MQQGNEGNSLVLVEKDVSLLKRCLMTQWNENANTKKIVSNFPINHERHMNDYLKSWETGSPTTDHYKKIKEGEKRPYFKWTL